MIHLVGHGWRGEEWNCPPSFSTIGTLYLIKRDSGTVYTGCRCPFGPVTQSLSHFNIARLQGIKYVRREYTRSFATPLTDWLTDWMHIIRCQPFKWIEWMVYRHRCRCCSTNRLCSDPIMLAGGSGQISIFFLLIYLSKCDLWHNTSIYGRGRHMKEAFVRNNSTGYWFNLPPRHGSLGKVAATSKARLKEGAVVSVFCVCRRLIHGPGFSLIH